MYIKVNEKGCITQAVEEKQEGFVYCPQVTAAAALFTKSGLSKYVFRNGQLILRDAKELLQEEGEKENPLEQPLAVPFKTLESRVTELEKAWQEIKKLLGGGD